MINYFSSSSVKDGDGDTVGDLTHDAARWINERRFSYVNIGDESSLCPMNTKSTVLALLLQLILRNISGLPIPRLTHNIFIMNFTFMPVKLLYCKVEF